MLALNLYFKLPFGQQHSDNPKIRKVAERLDRTAGSVNMKLNNFAAIDPDLDREGLQNYSEKDKDIWDEYWENLDELASVSETLYEEIMDETPGQHPSPEQSPGDEAEYGTEEKTLATQRKGQKFFRDIILTHYEHQCAVCRLQQPSLLDAAHIIDWSTTEDRNLRVNPRNGILLCAIHHRAFDNNALIIEPDSYTIQLSDILQEENTPGAQALFHQFEGTKIFLPERFKPKKAYLERSRT